MDWDRTDFGCETTKILGKKQDSTGREYRLIQLGKYQPGYYHFYNLIIADAQLVDLTLISFYFSCKSDFWLNLVLPFVTGESGRVYQMNFVLNRDEPELTPAELTDTINNFWAGIF
jgi:hypothetical protein